jgi:hypothetical protein
VYLPQLEEKVTGIFQAAVNCESVGVVPADADASSASGSFQTDVSWELWSSHPIVKVGATIRPLSLARSADASQSVTDVMGLVNSLCFMLSHTPFQQENYSRLIIGIIVRYYQRCSTHYRGTLEPLCHNRSLMRPCRPGHLRVIYRRRLASGGYLGAARRDCCASRGTAGHTGKRAFLRSNQN